MKKLSLLLFVLLIFNCKTKAQTEEKTPEVFEITKTDAEWKAQLTKTQYYVLREAGTERPGSSALNKNYEDGTYHCAA